MNIINFGSIAQGFATGGRSANNRKRSTRVIMDYEGRPRPGRLEPSRKSLIVGFSKDDYDTDTGEEDDPIMVEASSATVR